jgi:hypothetical protein
MKGAYSMKRSYSRLLTVIFVILVLCFSGCVRIQPAASGAANSASPEQSVQTEQPAPEGPALPDGDVQASFLFDLNGDGANETISVGLGGEGEYFGNEIILYVSDNGGFNQVTVDSGYFVSAYLTTTPGGAPCLLVCCGYEDDYTATAACSFDGLDPVVRGSVGGRVTDVSGADITISDWVNVLGTWPCTRIYEVTDGFAFEPLNDFQINMDGYNPLKTKVSLPVEMIKDGEMTPDTLKAGTLIFPVSTDGNMYLDFRLEDYSEGRIVYTMSDYERFIGSRNEFDCFEELPYAG